MFKTYQVKLCQSKPLARNIAKFSRECNTIYDLSIMMKLAHPRMSEYDLNYLLPGWRKWLNFDGAALMHEAAAKQTFQSMLKFRDTNFKKRKKRVQRKKDLHSGRIKNAGTTGEPSRPA